MWLAQTPGEQLEQIKSLQGIASIAATCAAQAGMLEHSVESLERGRTIAWGQVMQMRRAARLAAEANASLGERFREALSAQDGFARYVAPESFDRGLDRGSAPPRHLTESGPHPADLRLRLAQTWNEMVKEARRIPGLEDVMCPPGAAQLREAVQDGTVVLVNVAPARVTRAARGHDRIDNVPLPGLEVKATARRMADFTLALYALNASDVDYGPELRRHIARTLDETRRWLWEAIAEPVLGRLGIVRPPHAGEAWPRVWWCPTGMLTRPAPARRGNRRRPGVERHRPGSVLLHRLPDRPVAGAGAPPLVGNVDSGGERQTRSPALPALHGISREISSPEGEVPPPGDRPSHGAAGDTGRRRPADPSP